MQSEFLCALPLPCGGGDGAPSSALATAAAALTVRNGHVRTAATAVRCQYRALVEDPDAERVPGGDGSERLLPLPGSEVVVTMHLQSRTVLEQRWSAGHLTEMITDREPLEDRHIDDLHHATGRCDEYAYCGEDKPSDICLAR